MHRVSNGGRVDEIWPKTGIVGFLKIPQKIRKYIGSQMGDELKFGEILVNFWARGEILKSCEAQNGKGV